MDNIKAILLDIDNTLLDFDECVKDALKTGFKKYNIGQYEEWMFDAFTVENNKLWRQIELGELTLEGLEKIRFNKVFEKLGLIGDGIGFEAYFRGFIYNHAKLIDGAYELTKLLSKKYILAVASNGPYDQQVHRIKLVGLDKFISYYFISEKIGYSKPSLEFFRYALNELKIDDPSEVLIIGDSLSSDMAGGKKSGLKTIYFNKNKNKKITNSNVDIVCDSLEEIAFYLIK